MINFHSDSLGVDGTVDKTVKIPEGRSKQFVLSLPVAAVDAMRDLGAKKVSVIVLKEGGILIVPVNPPINHNPYKFPS